MTAVEEATTLSVVVPPMCRGRFEGLRFIFIEGNIGGGKSTKLEALRAAYGRAVTESAATTFRLPADGVAFIEEPLDAWLALDMEDPLHSGTRINIFELFNREPERYASLFQHCTFRTRMRALMSAIASGAKVLVMERSVFSDRHIFACTVHDLKLMNDIEWKFYLQEFEWATNEVFGLDERLCHFVYLATPPQEAAERIRRRARVGELASTGLSHGYLEALHARHEAWLGTESRPNVTRVDATSYTLDPVSIATAADALCRKVIIPTAVCAARRAHQERLITVLEAPTH